MRCIFDLGHPAHFHLFRHVIRKLKARGDDVVIVAREKDCLTALLDAKGWEYQSVAAKGSSLRAKFVQNYKTYRVIKKLAKLAKTDFIIGTSLAAGPAARRSKSISLVFNEDDADVVPMFAKVAYPFAHYIVTPESLTREDHGKKHIRYKGYHELAYLHPNNFRPDASVLKELGVSEGERYSLIRLVSLTAHHDIGQKGVGTEQAKELIRTLKKYGRVFISAERVIDRTLEPYLLPTRAERIFDVMAFADLVVGDSQTMAAEAAVMGTPSIRCNSFVGRLSYLEELEHKWGLTCGIRPDDSGRLAAKVVEWLSIDNVKGVWQEKRRKMLAECVDLTDWILKLLDGKE